MARSGLSVLASTLAIYASVRAFEDIRIPSTVTADEETTVTISNDLDEGSDSFDAGFEKYRLYLSTSPPGWGWGPACYLVNSSAIDVTSLKVTIPASVVPDGTDLMVTTMEFNDDPSLDGPSGFEYSNEFTLEGGTGAWGEAEVNGTTLGNPDRIPCTALKCARDCTDKYYPENMQEENLDTAVKDTYECVAACPGVDYPSWEEVTGGDDGDGESGSQTSSGASAQPTTSSANAASSTGGSPAQTTSASGTSSGTTTTSASPTTSPNGASRLSGIGSAILTAFGATLLFL